MNAFMVLLIPAKKLLNFALKSGSGNQHCQHHDPDELREAHMATSSAAETNTLIHALTSIATDGGPSTYEEAMNSP